jgi:hypothetical protein
MALAAGITAAKTQDTLQTTIIEVGQYVEKQAKIGEPITYSDVIRKFPDLLSRAAVRTRTASKAATPELCSKCW